MITYIIGHQKPDLDSVAAPIALQYLYEQAERLGYKNPQPLLADPINPETRYVLEKFGIPAPPLIGEVEISKDDAIILVDHNEPDQRADQLNEDQVVEIIDHHKPNLNLNRPLSITLKPWGSTATIVWWLMKINRVKPDEKLAALMLSAILSDTVGLKSPTTTQVDRSATRELAQIAKIHDVNELTLEIFKAKSNLDALSPMEKVTNDYKVFDFGGKKLLINQLETVEQEKVLREASALIEAMRNIKEEKSVDYAYTIISDVLQVNSKLIYTNPQEEALARKAFGDAQKVGEGIIDIGARISRKKQIAPAFERALSS